MLDKGEVPLSVINIKEMAQLQETSAQAADNNHIAWCIISSLGIIQTQNRETTAQATPSLRVQSRRGWVLPNALSTLVHCLNLWTWEWDSDCFKIVFLSPTESGTHRLDSINVQNNALSFPVELVLV